MNVSAGVELQLVAQAVACRSRYDDLFRLQVDYWLAVRDVVRNCGYLVARKRFALLSEAVAERLAEASVADVMRLCASEICTIGSQLPDECLLELLGKPEAPSSIRSAIALKQLFAGEGYERE